MYKNLFYLMAVVLLLGAVVTNTTIAKPPPGQASNPNPADQATNVSVTADLNWDAGSKANSHDVYFGTTSPGDFQDNQTATTFDPGTMEAETTYYWRIDEVNQGGTTTGVVWSFTTESAPEPPGQATNPNPSDDAIDVSPTADLSWTVGSGATSHDVYFGTTIPGDFQGNQTDTTFEPAMVGDTTYYWRIDEVNAGGTTTGNVWSFTTATAPTNECYNYETLHPEWIFCDDFETEQDLTVNYHDTDGGGHGMSVTTNDPYRGSYSLEQYYTIDQVNAGWVTRFIGDNPHLASPGEKLYEVYYRYYHKFEAGFSDLLPPKMSRCKIFKSAQDWSGILGVYQWIGYEDDGILVADIKAVNQWLPVTLSTLDYADPANIGRWICIEVRIELNTPGESDGEVQYWADGEEILYATGLDLDIGDKDKGLNMVMLDCYWNAGSPAEQSRFYDNYVISTAPIGLVQE